MLLILKPHRDGPEREGLKALLQARGIAVQPLEAKGRVVLLLEGDTARLDPGLFSAHPLVEEVVRLSPPYGLAAREARPEGTVLSLGNARLGGGALTLIAGPCAVESEEQVVKTALSVKESGASLLRGGAFKPRSSPYAFQGLGEEGLRLLSLAKRETGLPLVSEIMEASQLPLFADVDVLQVGARNMQNFPLLRALGGQEKPVLLKRNPSASYEELLMSAEYIMAAGNEKVILCERGFSGGQDAAAAPILKALSHLPVLVDPSHGAGRRDLVSPLALAAAAAGADGLLIEVHIRPEQALCDGAQALSPEDFAALAAKLFALEKLKNTRPERA